MSLLSGGRAKVGLTTYTSGDSADLSESRLHGFTWLVSFPKSGEGPITNLHDMLRRSRARPVSLTESPHDVCFHGIPRLEMGWHCHLAAFLAIIAAIRRRGAVAFIFCQDYKLVVVVPAGVVDYHSWHGGRFHRLRLFVKLSVGCAIAIFHRLVSTI